MKRQMEELARTMQLYHQRVVAALRIQVGGAAWGHWLGCWTTAGQGWSSEALRSGP